MALNLRQRWQVLKTGLSLALGKTPDTGLLSMFEAGFEGPPRRRRADWLVAYSEMPWLHAVVHKIATAVGEVPAEVRVERGGGVEVLSPQDHPLAALIEQPNPRMSGYILRYLLQAHLDLVGDGFWLIERNRVQRPAELWPIPPSWVTDLPTPDLPFFEVRFPVKRAPREGFHVRIPESEIVWFQQPDPANPYRWGLGTARALADEMESDEWAAKWNKKFFFNRARPDFILGIEGITKPDAEKVQAEWVSRYGGFWNAFKPAVLDASKMTVHELTKSQRDMDFANLRRWSRDMAVAVFGVSPEVLGIVENSNRATAETAEFVFARWTVLPRLRLIQETIQRDLVAQFDSRLIFAFQDPVPENREFKLQQANDGLKGSALKVNEWREANGWEPLPDGDVLMIPFNIVPTGSLGGTPPRQEEGAKHRGLSEEAKDSLATQIDRIARASETPWIERLRSYFRGQHKRILEALESLEPKGLAGKAEGDIVDGLIDWGAETNALHQVLEILLSLTLEESGERILGTLGVGISFDVLNPRVIQFLEEEGLSKAKQIIGTSKETVREVLVQGMREGEGAPELARRLRPLFEKDEQYRSVLVARTETISASNFGSLEGMRQSGAVQRKEWWAALDERVCDICGGLHGEVVDLERTFSWGIQQPPAHPQCRCTVLPVID